MSPVVGAWLVGRTFIPALIVMTLISAVALTVIVIVIASVLNEESMTTSLPVVTIVVGSVALSNSKPVGPSE